MTRFFGHRSINIKKTICFFENIFILSLLLSQTSFGQTEAPKTIDFYELRGESVVGRPMQVFGNIKLSDGYYDEFRKAQKTHYSFKLSSPDGLYSLYVYMKHGDKADELYTKLFSTEKDAKLEGAFTVSVKSVKDMFTYPNAELLDFTLGAKKPEPPKPTFQNPSGVVKVSYDKFKDETAIIGTAHILDCQDRSDAEPVHGDFIAIITFEGKKSTATPAVELRLRLLKYDIGRNPDFIFFVDDKRLALGKGRSQPKFYKIAGLTSAETVSTITIPFDSFKLIANSKKIEVKVGELEFAPPFVESDAIQKILPVFREMLDTLEKQ